MDRGEIDPLAINRGLITAPAGCGKTHLISEALVRHGGTKPILVLTHTNAGVAALRSRLDRAGVPPKRYRLGTIDGWAIRMVSTFPARSGLNPKILRIEQPATDYPSIRAAAVSLLKAGHISDVLEASYSRIIVDEYQDCSIRQHSIVGYAARSLPTCVLGDPMQAIFDFGTDGLADWDEHVCKYFPVVGELETPWRWINAGAEDLGRWLLDVRRELARGASIDLRHGPASVRWVELDGSEDRKRQLVAARTSAPVKDGRVLIIGDSASPGSQRILASQTPGAVTVEAVDLKDLVAFAATFALSREDALKLILQFAQTVMTNVGAEEVLRRVVALQRGTARKGGNEVERAALAFAEGPTHSKALELLVEIGKAAGVRAYRPAVLAACTQALRLCMGTEGLTFHEAVIQMREQQRMLGRFLPRRGVGSTLLLKGLEADLVVVLDAGSMNAPNLYVAMTRGARALTVCSQSPVLNDG